MTWNHRVVREFYPNARGSDRYMFSIREVYYREKKGDPKAWSGNPREPIGSNLEELRECLTMMLWATYKPALEPTGRGGHKLREIKKRGKR